MLAPVTMRNRTATLQLDDYLQTSRLFGSLSANQVDRIAANSTVRHLPAKTQLGVPSNQNSQVHLFLSGLAKVSYLTRDGKQPILYFVNPDELVGEQSIFHAHASEDYVLTMEKSVVATIPSSILRELVLSDPVFATAISELISRRRMRSENRTRQLLFLSNRERLTHLLLDLADQYGSGTADNLLLNVRLSHQDLANYIGSTRETVTVVLGKMQLEGLLAVKRRQITLLDVRALAKSVERVR